MQVPKPTEADKARFRALVPADPRVEVKPMFGNLGAFVNGNMFMGLFGPHIGLKLGPAAAAELVQVEGSGPFGPPERPMSGWVSLPSVAIDSSIATGFVGRALEHVAGLPPKAARKR